MPSGYVIGTSTADVLTSLIVSCGSRAALPVLAIIGAPFRLSQLVVCDWTDDLQIWLANCLRWLLNVVYYHGKGKG